jgi:hypothetical protein
VVAASLAVVAGLLMPVPTLLAMAIAAGIYAGALMLLGAVPPELLDLVMLRGDAPSDE